MMAEDHYVAPQTGLGGGDAVIESIVRRDQVAIEIASDARFDFRGTNRRGLGRAGQRREFRNGDQGLHRMPMKPTAVPLLLSDYHCDGSAADIDHSPGRRYEVGLIDAMPGLLFHHYRLDEFGDLFVAGSSAQKKLQIMVLLAEQADAELSVGRKADARAEAAERLANRCNQADFAGGPIGEAVLAGGLAAFVGNLNEGPLRVNAALDFG